MRSWKLRTSVLHSLERNFQVDSPDVTLINPTPHPHPQPHKPL